MKELFSVIRYKNSLWIDTKFPMSVCKKFQIKYFCCKVWVNEVQNILPLQLDNPTRTKNGKKLNSLQKSSEN